MQQPGAQQSKGEKSQLREQAADKAKQVGEQARSAVDNSKDQIARRMENVAQAFHRTSDQLRSEQQDAIGKYADAIAEQIERIAKFLDSRDVRDMAGEVERFARRRPGLFVGGAFALGLLTARFVKSSTKSASQGTGQTSASEADMAFGAGTRAGAGEPSSVETDIIVTVGDERSV